MIEYVITNKFDNAFLKTDDPEKCEIGKKESAIIPTEKGLRIQAVSTESLKVRGCSIRFNTKTEEKEELVNDFQLTVKREGDAWILEEFSHPETEFGSRPGPDNPVVPVEIGPDGQ